MGTSCVALVVVLFLYSYEVEFIHEIFRKNDKKQALSFTFHYIDDVLSQIIKKIGDDTMLSSSLQRSLQ